MCVSSVGDAVVRVKGERVNIVKSHATPRHFFLKLLFTKKEIEKARLEIFMKITLAH